MFRYRDRRPLTRRRYNTLFDRLHRVLGWPAARNLGVHHIRHTTLTDVERAASMAVARA